jgi:hypothetical protein
VSLRAATAATDENLQLAFQFRLRGGNPLLVFALPSRWDAAGQYRILKTSEGRSVLEV